MFVQTMYVVTDFTFNLEAQKIQSAKFVNNKLINSCVMTKKYLTGLSDPDL